MGVQIQLLVEVKEITTWSVGFSNDFTTVHREKEQ